MQLPTLETPRMLLRSVTAEDRAAYVRMWRESEHVWSRWFPRLPEGETPEMLFDRKLLEASTPPESGGVVRLVGVLPDGQIAGLFNLAHIVRGAFQNASASWSVSANVLRQGYGAEGVQGMLDLAFAPEPRGLGLHRVQANIIPGNIASTRLAEKLRFRCEGIGLRFLKINGQWQDHAMYAKLADEHQAMFLSDPAAPSVEDHDE